MEMSDHDIETLKKDVAEIKKFLRGEGYHEKGVTEHIAEAKAVAYKAMEGVDLIKYWMLGAGATAGIVTSLLNAVL